MSMLRIIENRYLLDKEITEWSLYTSKFSKKTSIKQFNDHLHSHLSLKIDDYFISKFEYRLSFSILSSKVDIYYKILENLKKKGVPKNNLVVSGVKSNFSINEDIIYLNMFKFNILDKEYVTFDYLFVGDIVKIIPYVTIVSDSIKYLDFFEKNCLKIGDIVSPIDDKSKNLLINNYIFCKIDDNYHAYYDTVELLNFDGHVLNHGSDYIYRYDEICISRNSKIDSILKN